MTGPPANATVLDTTVLSNFGQVDRVELLYELPRIVTVSAVKEELRAGAGTHPYIRRALAALGDEIPVVTPTASAEKREEGFLETLDPGEAQALAVAETVDGVLVSDDGDARSAAEKRGLSVTGSIGLLVRFVEDGQISSQAADGYLKRWIDEAGFRSPDRDFAVFLDE